MSAGFRKFWIILAFFFLFFLAVRYLLPLALPFLLGSALAFAAEPMVHFLTSRFSMRRGLASGIGVGMAFCFLGILVLLLCGLLVRELRALSGILPEAENALRSGMQAISARLLSLADRAPEGIRSFLIQNVTSFFTGGSALLDRIAGFSLRLASGILSHVPDSAITLGTGILSSFMISAKLPAIRNYLKNRLPVSRIRPLLEGLTRLKHTLWSWLKAQFKLSCVTFLVTTGGYLLLRIPYAPLWGFVTALVDAFPILGTGAILLPWSLVSFLQGLHHRAFGLLGIYAAAALVRSVLEPRLVGKHLGLDPLVTLAALYTGYRLFGILGMIIAPIIAVAAAQFVVPGNQNRKGQAAP